MRFEMIDALRAGCRRDPDEHIARALEAVCELTQSSAAAWYRLALVGNDVVPSRWILRGVDDVFVRPRFEERIGWSHADPRRPDPRWNRRFVLLRNVAEPLAATPLYERCYRPAGVHDVLRMIVLDGGCFAGWIGALRLHGEPAFARADVRRVAPMADAIADALLAADAADRERCPPACDLVLRPDGSIELASDCARALLASVEARRELGAFARRFHQTGSSHGLVCGLRVRASLLRGTGEARLLVHLEPLEPLRLHPTYVLTNAQREIAALAVAGATVREIGIMTGTAHATVRAHLREIYARLDVSCRAELAGALHRSKLDVAA